MNEELLFLFATVAMAWGIHMVDLGIRKTEGFVQFVMFFIASALILMAIKLTMSGLIQTIIAIVSKQTAGG